MNNEISNELNDTEMFKLVIRNMSSSLGIKPDDLMTNPNHAKRVKESIIQIKKKQRENISSSSLWNLISN
jgi:hypothetical protein